MIAIALRKRNRLGIGLLLFPVSGRSGGFGALTTSTMFGPFQQAFHNGPYGKTAEDGKMAVYEP